MVHESSLASQLGQVHPGPGNSRPAYLRPADSRPADSGPGDSGSGHSEEGRQDLSLCAMDDFLVHTLIMEAQARHYQAELLFNIERYGIEN